MNKKSLKTMSHVFLKIGLLEEKGFLKKGNRSSGLGWQYLPHFPFNNPLAIREVIGILEHIKLELERDMELLGAKSMLDEFYEFFNNDAKPKIKEHLAKCNTIEEVHEPFPEDILKEMPEETAEDKKGNNE